MEDPYRELREFVDPVTGGGPLDPKFRRQIGELLREHGRAMNATCSGCGREFIPLPFVTDEGHCTACPPSASDARNKRLLAQAEGIEHRVRMRMAPDSAYITRSERQDAADIRSVVEENERLRARRLVEAVDALPAKEEE